MSKKIVEGMRVANVEGWHPVVSYIRELEKKKYMLRVEPYFDSVLHQHCWSMAVYLHGAEAQKRGVKLGQEGVWREGTIHGGRPLQEELEAVFRYAKEVVLPRAREIAEGKKG